MKKKKIRYEYVVTISVVGTELSSGFTLKHGYQSDAYRVSKTKAALTTLVGPGFDDGDLLMISSLVEALVEDAGGFISLRRLSNLRLARGVMVNVEGIRRRETAC